MTDDMIALRELLEKGSDATLLREMIGFAAQRLMALETDALCGAGHGERTSERINHRNGFRDRDWEDPRGHRRAAHTEAPGLPCRRAAARSGSCASAGWVSARERDVNLDPCFEGITPSVSRHVTASRRRSSFQLDNKAFRPHHPSTRTG